jgi:hypothetical protein
MLFQLLLRPLSKPFNKIRLVLLHFFLFSAKAAAKQVIRDTAKAPAALTAGAGLVFFRNVKNLCFGSPQVVISVCQSVIN